MIKTHSRIAHFWLFLVVSLFLSQAFTACSDFEDGSQSLLKKPELLSVVLDPPEAAPGETVHASFLFADARGVVPDPFSLWLPGDVVSVGGEGGEPGALLADLGLTELDLLAPDLEFTVPPRGRYHFDADGIAIQPFSLAVAAEPPAGLDDPDLDDPDLDVMELIESGALKPGLRNLVVSEREIRNQNPGVLGITVRDGEENETPAVLARSGDLDLAAARQAAADNPVVITAGDDLTLIAELTDDGDDLETDVRVQWISTAGDFQEVRKLEQPWDGPGYVVPGEGERDQTGETNVDPRTDPNLRPVWLVVRDDEVPGQLGQCWAELYVRVVP